MTLRDKKSGNIRQYKRRREMNIGILIFAVVFIYLIVTIIMYATSKRISVYEVREGSIVKDNSYTGVIVRDETVVYAEAGGYVSYFQNENSKVKTGSNVYALSSEKLDTESITATEGVSLTDEEEKNLILKAQNFNENYDAQKFSSVYSLKNEYTSVLQNAGNQTRTTQLDSLIASSGSNITVYPCVRDGIIVTTFDGYEELTEDDLTADVFDRSAYEAVYMTDQMKVKAGDPVYKLVTGENWQVYVQLDQETAESLAETTYVKTRIDKDSETIWADFSILVKDDHYYGCLSYDNSMIRYSGERFLNVELILEDQSGLKIPKSAVVEKEFYVVPSEYLTSSGSGYSRGVLVKDGNEAKYQAVDIYDTTEDGEICLNPNDFENGAVLVKPESSETYTLSEKKKLTGVYNINKGYAVFNVVKILCENDDYYIVQEGTSYGLTNYDHIVQDGNTVEEDEVVFQ